MWTDFVRVLRLGGSLAAATAVGIQFGGSSRNGEADKEERKEWTTLTPFARDSEPHYPSFDGAIQKSRELLDRCKIEVGAPGIVVGVSVDGKDIWNEGVGYSDVENRVPCSKDTVMRIASVSKSITMTAVAKLWEEGKLDLDKPVHEYVKGFPQKTHLGEKCIRRRNNYHPEVEFEPIMPYIKIVRNTKYNDPGQEIATCERLVIKKRWDEVVITSRHLVSHTSGIRHYQNASPEVPHVQKIQTESSTTQKTPPPPTKEFENKEYFIKDAFPSVTDALRLFKDDPLAFKPGTDYLYTTHGWTLISAVVEAAAGMPFTKYITRLFDDLGMHHTFLDIHERLIPNRARFYVRNKNGKIENAPYVDNSYKWAGGGFLSTVGDLTRFGNVMLYSYQQQPLVDDPNSKSESSCALLPGFLKKAIMEQMWTPVLIAKLRWASGGYYSMGWAVVPFKIGYGFCKDHRQVIAHTGGAVGASSVLLILPRTTCSSGRPPQGIVVAIVTNLQEVGLYKLALEIAKQFDEALGCPHKGPKNPAIVSL